MFLVVDTTPFGPVQEPVADDQAPSLRQVPASYSASSLTPLPEPPVR